MTVMMMMVMMMTMTVMMMVMLMMVVMMMMMMVVVMMMMMMMMMMTMTAMMMMMMVLLLMITTLMRMQCMLPPWPLLSAHAMTIPCPQDLSDGAGREYTLEKQLDKMHQSDVQFEVSSLITITIIFQTSTPTSFGSGPIHQLVLEFPVFSN